MTPEPVQPAEDPTTESSDPVSDWVEDIERMELAWARIEHL